MRFKTVCFVLSTVVLLLTASAGAFAQVTVSGGFALSSVNSKDSSEEAKTGLGFNVYVDYLLPVSIPLSLGFEAGYDTAGIESTRTYYDYSYGGYEEYTETTEVKVAVIPLLFRIAYHLDLSSRLDLYLVGKFGYAFEVWEGVFIEQAPDTFTFGVDIGAAYYLSPRFGLFAEAGYDSYGDYFNRFVTFGISTKF
ncbi:MAG: porin family protein [Spirochaetaceae bacterium]|nr:porin family protein [Spirochaetaceae bacterium]